MIGYILDKLFPFFKKYLPYKEMGWSEYNEIFYRFTIFKCNYFNIYLHWLDAPNWYPKCHDHPWHFWTILLAGGYYEYNGKTITHRYPGEILFRHAKFSHNIVTKSRSWSLVITSHKVRNWNYLKC